MNQASVKPGALRPLREGDLRVGEPLAQPVYDRSGTLLLQEGTVVETAAQRETLLSRGSLVPVRHPSAAAVAPPPPEPVGTIQAMQALHRDVALMHRRLLAGNASDVRERVERMTATIDAHLARDADAALAAMQLQLDPTDHAARQTHAAIVCAFAMRRMALGDEEARAVAGAALTYDVALGPLAIQLNGQSECLSPAQQALVRAHPDAGARMLREAGIDDPVWIDAVLHHHERLDGSGYPHGLRGDAIRPTTRLLAIVDIYTAMLRPRIYRDALTAQVALRSIFLERGRLVDDHLATMLVKELGVFPPGTLVRLANGETGVVLRRGADAAHPQVSRVVTAEGFRASVPVLRDTREPEFAIVESVPYDRHPGVVHGAASLWK